MIDNLLSYELTFSAIEKFSQIAVFNLQASDYVHYEEEEGSNPNVSLHIYTYFFFSSKFTKLFFPANFITNFKTFRKFYCSL